MLFCLTTVRLSVAYIGPNSRTERPRKTKIGTEVAHVTRDSDTTPLVADVLNSQHAGTGATWRINAKIMSTCRGGGILCRHAHSLLLCTKGAISYPGTVGCYPVGYFSQAMCYQVLSDIFSSPR